jgi:hypothetical protein
MAGGLGFVQFLLDKLLLSLYKYRYEKFYRLILKLLRGTNNECKN